tara:strand:- start:462 stop:656 length:195 start_codon:yes stop_codon:yes gene_type:complete
MSGQHRRCHNCGGADEFLYTIRGKPLYYCAGCDRQTGTGIELVGTDEQPEDATIVKESLFYVTR